MSGSRNLWVGLCGGLAGLGGLMLAAGSAQADDVGDALAAAGATQFSINAGDAIRVTCRDLGARNQSDGLTAGESDLFGRCGDMVNTALNVVGGVTTAQNRYGLNTNSEVYATLRQFSGEEASTQGRYATEGLGNQSSAISNRLTAIRTGVRTSTFAVNFSGVDLVSAANDGSPVNLIGGNAGEASGDSGFAWFGTVDYGWGDRDASDNEDEYDSDSYGGTVGIDYAFGNGLVLGAAGGYTTHDIDFKGDPLSSLVDPVTGGSMDIDSWTISGFADYHRGANYVSAIVEYGGSDYDIERLIVVPASTSGAAAQNRRIVSDTDSDQYSIEVQVGHTFGQAATTFDLYGGYQITSIDVDGFTETDLNGGSLGLVFGDQDIDSKQWILGGTLRHAFNTQAGVLVPYATAEWHHETDNNSRFVDARYALAVGDVNGDGQSDNFSLPTDDPDDDYFDLVFGLAGQLPNNLVLFFEYSGVVGLKDTSANLLTLGIRGTF